MADNLEFGVDLRLDVAQIARAVDQIAGQFEQVLNSNLKVSKSFDNVAASSAQAMGRVAASTEQAARATRGFDNVAEELANDLRAVAATAKATEATLSQVGADPELFAVARRELERVLQLQTKFENDFERIAQDGNLLRSYVQQFEQIRTPLSKSVSNLNELLRSTSRDRGNIQQAENIRLRAQLDEQADIRKKARSEFVAITQQETTLRNAEIRTQGQLQLQTDRRVARTRLEILRFTLGQVRSLERAIGAVFRGTAAIISGAYTRIEGSVARLGQVFRRSNRSLDDGLQGALLARERSIRRSFSRQTSEINLAVTQQSAAMDRLDRRLSTGVLGAATGRSRLGGLVGGGLAVGGGYAAVRALREGFDESVNLQESLNKTREIFGEATEDVVTFSEDSVAALFTTQSAALEAASNFGIFGKAAGLVGDDLSSFSNRLTLLATDLASFNNTSVEDATTAISAALRGESEPIRRFGVLLNEATLQQRAFEIGVTDTVRKLEPFERVLAANAEILAQTVDQQGDAARTADDFANSSKRAGAAATEAFAAFARFLIPFATAITNQAYPALQALTRFIEGDVSPALQVFRRALFGAVAGLTALLVAKTAAEAVRVLGVALRFTLTPLGLVAVAAASLGAAIAVFTQRSDAFASGIRGIIDVTQELAGRGLNQALAALNALAALVGDRLLPPLVRLASQLAGPVRRGIEIAFGFVLNVAVPAVQALAAIVADQLLPALVAVVGVITSRVVPALQAFAGLALGVLSTIVDFLRPAIAGFASLGAAIAEAFQTGDLGGLLDGLERVASGLGRVFANLGILLYDAIAPHVLRAVDSIVAAFQNIDLAAIGLEILEIVRLIGYVLGSVVSDPRFIAALAAIAAAAAALVGSFVLGVAEGIKSNIPELAALLGEGVMLAFKEAFSDLTRLGVIVGAALIAVLASRAVKSAWARAGKAGAAGMATGFAARVRSLPDLTAGLFGGSAALERRAEVSAKKATQAYTKEFQRANRELVALGQTPTFNPKGGVDAKAVKDVNKRLAETRTRLTEAGSAAVVFRSRASTAMSSFGQIVGGVFRSIAARSTADLQTAEVGVRRLALVASDSFRSFQSNLKARGVGMGQALGAGTLAGFGAYLSGQQGGSVGIAGILASSLGALSTTGSPLIAGAVAGIGAFSYVLGNNKRAAEEAAAAIDTYAAAIVNAGSVAAAAGDLGKIVSDEIGKLDLDQQQLLEGFDIAGFVAAVTSGEDAAKSSFAGIARAIGVPQEAIQRFLEENERFGRNTQGDLQIIAGAFRDELGDAGVSLGEFYDVYKAFNEEGGFLKDALEEARLELERLNSLKIFEPAAVNASRRQFEEAMGLTGDGGFVGAAEFAADRVGVGMADISGAVRAASNAVGGGAGRFVRAFGSIAEATGEFFSNIDLGAAFDFDLSSFLESVQVGVDESAFSFDRIGIAVGSLNQNLREADKIKIDPLEEDAIEKVDLLGAAISEVKSQRTDALRAQIEGVSARLDEATEAAEAAREALTAFITGRYADTAQAQVDDLIGDIGGIGSAIEEALLQGGVRGDAALRSAVGGFESTIAGIIQAGFDDGLRTQDEFRQLLAPLFAAIDEEGGDALSRILSTVDFEAGFTSEAASHLVGALNNALSGDRLEVGVRGILDSQASQSALQAQLDSLQAQLDVDVVVTPSQVQEALVNAFNEAGVPLDFLPDIDGAAIASAQRTGLAGTVAAEYATQVDVEQNVPIQINVTGSSDSVATAAEINAGLNAAVTGIPAPIIKTGTRIATGASRSPGTPVPV